MTTRQNLFNPIVWQLILKDRAHRRLDPLGRGAKGRGHNKESISQEAHAEGSNPVEGVKPRNVSFHACLHVFLYAYLCKNVYMHMPFNLFTLMCAYICACACVLRCMHEPRGDAQQDDLVGRGRMSHHGISPGPHLGINFKVKFLC
jgi:hypothetical protein